VTTAGLFVASILIIVGGSELFTNAVEWAGHRLGLARGATGSLLAALGTALPETTVPIVAVAGRRPSADGVAVGAILGAPLLLLTLGLAVTGIAVLSRHDARELVVEPRQVHRDLGTFIAGFSILMVGFVLPEWARVVAAIAVLVLYAGYVRATLRGGDPSLTEPEPLHLVRRRPGAPPSALIGLQLMVGVAALIGGAELFVRAIEDLAHSLTLAPLLLSLVVVPVATELPETLNSVLWVRARSDWLALGNVAGATAFQACIPGAFGLVFTSWRPGPLGLASALLSLAMSGAVLALLRRGRSRGWWLLCCGLPWVVLVAVIATTGQRLQAS